VTDAVRRALEDRLSGLEFRPVRLAHIVNLEWHRWDATQKEPPTYPDSGEPEDFILEAPHDPSLAKSMGPLWELVPTVSPGIQRKGGRFVPARYRGGHLERETLEAGYSFVSATLRDALLAIARDWVAFETPRMDASE